MNRQCSSIYTVSFPGESHFPSNRPEEDSGLFDVGGVAVDEVPHEVGVHLVAVLCDPPRRRIHLLEHVVVVLVHLRGNLTISVLLIKYRYDIDCVVPLFLCALKFSASGSASSANLKQTMHESR